MKRRQPNPGVQKGQRDDLQAEHMPGVEINFGDAKCSRAVDVFLTLTEQHGLVLPDFDWQEWSLTEEAQRLQLSGDAVTRASVAKLSKLITLIVRRGRFVEGSLEEAARAGLLAAITIRLKSLGSEF